MPNKPKTSNNYYSFNMGPAHIIAFSSEAYFWQLWEVTPLDPPLPPLPGARSQPADHGGCRWRSNSRGSSEISRM
jgi:hypothetical protein